MLAVIFFYSIVIFLNLKQCCKKRYFIVSTESGRYKFEMTYIDVGWHCNFLCFCITFWGDLLLPCRAWRFDDQWFSSRTFLGRRFRGGCISNLAVCLGESPSKFKWNLQICVTLYLWTPLAPLHAITFSAIFWTTPRQFRSNELSYVFWPRVVLDSDMWKLCWIILKRGGWGGN